MAPGYTDLDSTCRQHKKAGSLLHEMPMPNNRDPLAGRCVEHIFPVWQVSFVCWIQSSVVAAHCLDM